MAVWGKGRRLRPLAPLHVCRSAQPALRTSLGTVLQAAGADAFRCSPASTARSYETVSEVVLDVISLSSVRNLVSWVGAPAKQINPLRVRADLGFRTANSNSYRNRPAARGEKG
jgi:hypothetical protein